MLGPAGSGKSSVVLALVRAGFMLVADDQVIVTDGVARGPAALSGLIEVRGVGIVQLPYLRAARIVIAVTIGRAERVAGAAQHPTLGIPMINVDVTGAVARIEASLRCPAIRIV